ncbi:MAG: hypothetical protein HC896_10355 [Bacteroidales bacterium]|nr:hypothetical protein [Bacteroidales bacterium]
MINHGKFRGVLGDNKNLFVACVYKLTDSLGADAGYLAITVALNNALKLTKQLIAMSLFLEWTFLKKRPRLVKYFLAPTSLTTLTLYWHR